MTIFDAIINNNLELVKLMIGGGVAHPHDIQPESFYRRNQKTVLQVAEFLKRERRLWHIC